ncbi:MAG: hypothetical protein IJ516_00935, partial [Phascolarctobacterium sp.]|nr:hypothetical protein [Phascolarctobacterium sp.]
MLKKNSKTFAIALCMTTMASLYAATPAWADQTINDNVVINGTAYVASDTEINGLLTVQGNIVVAGDAITISGEQLHYNDIKQIDTNKAAIEAINDSVTGIAVTAAADATTKANAAEANAKAYTDGELANYTDTAGMNSAIATAKNDAISAAAADATTKANAAEANAKAYTDGELANYTDTAGMNSAIATAKNDAIS